MPHTVSHSVPVQASATSPSQQPMPSKPTSKLKKNSEPCTLPSEESNPQSTVSDNTPSTGVSSFNVPLPLVSKSNVTFLSDISINSTCWIVGNIQPMQLAANQLGLKVTMTLSEQQLTDVSKVAVALSQSAPDIVLINLPGVVCKLGNQRDRRISRNLSSLIQHQLALNKHVLVHGADRSPSWQMTDLEATLSSNSVQLRTYDINWCQFPLPGIGNSPIDRKVKIVTSIRRLSKQDNIKTGGCDHDIHTTIRHPSVSLLASAFKVMFEWLLRGQGRVLAVASANPNLSRNHKSNGQASQVLHANNARDPDNLGDHADVAQANPIEYGKQKKIPIEEVFDDCGDDDTEIATAVDKDTYFSSCDIFTDSDTSEPEVDHTKTHPHAGVGNYMTTSLFVVNTTHDKSRHDLCQIFGSKGTVLRLAIRKKLKAGPNFDAVCDVDLSNLKDRRELWRYLQIHRPKVVVGSPPSWSNLNAIRAPQAHKKNLRLALPLVKLIADVCLWQIRNGAHYIIEDPYVSKLFSFRCFRDLLKHPSSSWCRCDQCVFDLKDADDGVLYRHTKFIASNPLLLHHLAVRCDGSHKHTQIQGTCQGISRARVAQTWPHKLCVAVARGVSDLLQAEQVYVTKKTKQQKAESEPTAAAPAEPEERAQSAPSAPSNCVGCRVHARRDDPRHNRHPQVCRFPLDSAVTWSCDACQNHRHSLSFEHTRAPGECQRASAASRRTGSRVAAKRISVIPAETVEPVEEVLSSPTENITPISRSRSSRVGVIGEDDSQAGKPNPSTRIRQVGEPVTPPPAKQDIEYDEQQLAIPAVDALAHRDEAQRAEPSDWSNWTLGRNLSLLRSDKKPDIIRGLRQMHIRLWHATSARMTALLKAAGVDSAVTSLVDSVVGSCRICRMWQRPDNRAATATRMSVAFNQAIQMDLLFVEDVIIMHILDEATRFGVATIIKDKKPETITSAFTQCWIRYFGTPDLVITDQEGALCSEHASIWSERFGASFQFKAKQSHAHIVERHHEMLRDQIHKILAQLRTEQLTVDMESVVAEAMMAKNMMISVHGVSPYMAVFGRFPRILADMEKLTISAADDTSGPFRNAVRLREIALESIVTGIATDRLKQASHSKARVPGEQLELQAGQLVDIFRQPTQKDLTGWRGPCEVISTRSLERGTVDVRWNGRTLVTRVADIRKHILFVGFMDQDAGPVRCIREFSSTLHQCSQTFSWIMTSSGWQLSNAGKQNPEVFRALVDIGVNHLQLSNVVGGRVGRGLNSIPGIHGIDHSVLVWFSSDDPANYRSLAVSGSRHLRLDHLFGDGCLDFCWFQILTTDTHHAKRIRLLAPEEPLIASQSFDDDDDTRPDTGRDASMRSPVSSARTDATIPEAHAVPVPTDTSMESSVASSELRPHTSAVQSQRSDVPVLSESSASSFTRSRSRAVTSSRSSSSTPSNSTLQPTIQSRISPVVSEQAAASTSNESDQEIVPDTESSTITLESDVETIPEGPVDSAAQWFFATSAPYVPAWWNGLAVSIGEVAQSHCFHSCRSASVDSMLPYSHQLEFELSPELSQLNCFHNTPASSIAVYTVDKTTGEVKVGIEREADALTPSEVNLHWDLVSEAILKELESFKALSVFEKVPVRDADNLMSSRWVLRWKVIDSRRVVKARLTARGFEDMAASSLATYASTAARWSQRLVISACVQRSWQLVSWDISTAFLQGYV